jgi:hypothetical protein
VHAGFGQFRSPRTTISRSGRHTALLASPHEDDPVELPQVVEARDQVHAPRRVRLEVLVLDGDLVVAQCRLPLLLRGGGGVKTNEEENIYCGLEMLLFSERSTAACNAKTEVRCVEEQLCFRGGGWLVDRDFDILTSDGPGERMVRVGVLVFAPFIFTGSVSPKWFLLVSATRSKRGPLSSPWPSPFAAGTTCNRRRDVTMPGGRAIFVCLTWKNAILRRISSVFELDPLRFEPTSHARPCSHRAQNAKALHDHDGHESSR